MLLGSNAGDIIAALCPGDDIAVCCQQKIGIFDGGTAQLQLLGAFAEEAFCFREGDGLPGSASGNSDKPPDKGVLFVFCRYI